MLRPAPSTRPPLRMLDLCSGIGGMTLGAEIAGGVQTVAFSEVEPFACAVLAHQRPHTPNLGDIHGLSRERIDGLGVIDVVAGGIPCQPWSLSGRRGGTGDNRHLWPAMLAVIERCQPSLVVVENVAGFTGVALPLVQADLDAHGYDSWALVLPLAALGAPHKRERVFIVGHAQRLGRIGQSVITAGHHRHGPPARWQKGPGGAAQPGQAGAAQPGLGGVFNGLSRWLDEHPWPAAQGAPQHEWEPPRTVTGRHPDRAARVKALGNAIAPIHVAPIFATALGIHWALMDAAA